MALKKGAESLWQYLLNSPQHPEIKALSTKDW